MDKLIKCEFCKNEPKCTQCLSCYLKQQDIEKNTREMGFENIIKVEIVDETEEDEDDWYPEEEDDYYYDMEDEEDDDNDE